MLEIKSNSTTKKKASLGQAWIKNDLNEFSLAVTNLEDYHVNAAIKLIDNNISSVFKGERFELLKVLVPRLYSINEESKLRYSPIVDFEQKILINYSAFQIKNKNINYLNFCSLFLKSENIYKLAEKFSTEKWAEGWRLFTNENLNKMPEEVKLKYLKHTFLLINPELLVEIENTFDAKTINKYLNEIQNQTPNQFWISNFTKQKGFSDEEKVFLLEFSEKYSHSISNKTKDNFFPFINKNSPETIFYMIKKTSYESIQLELYPYFEQQIKEQKTNPSFKENFAFLRQCVLERNCECIPQPSLVAGCGSSERVN